MKYKTRPIVIDAISFTELVEFGKKYGGNLVDGMPWSFQYKGHPVTHENDECYIVDSDIKINISDMLVLTDDGNAYSCNEDIFKKICEDAT